MLGDTLTVTLDGSGGTARICSKINQDSYSAEYLNRISTDEIRVKVRHQKESRKNGETYPLERHNVTISQTVFETVSASEQYREISFTMRNRPNDTDTDVVNLGEAMTYYLTDTILGKLFIWES